ncbi:rutC family protein in vnfA 5'region-like isoform X2 [Daktulosphaira vitifoliae]|uniref:rutC family protein in vnfA 5'region-like isoform X2 n=1 Tax=Daktulosphaira vitifoliae TaxID=58002 RepID=UPI0021AA72E7|nr:rutC family protein in vnfA 5'region-like isoform X2 [Daktulosphaira vitifoliae]
MTTDVNYIRTSKAPLPVVGTMNQAVVAGNTVFVSGTLGYTPGSLKLVSDNLEEQTIQTFRNVIAILEAAGSSTRNVFGSKTGAKTYLQPSSMYPDVKIQMEAIGITGKMEVEIKYDQ